MNFMIVCICCKQWTFIPWCTFWNNTSYEEYSMLKQFI